MVIKFAGQPGTHMTRQGCQGAHQVALLLLWPPDFARLRWVWTEEVRMLLVFSHHL